jgi:hypothetical protein
MPTQTNTIVAATGNTAINMDFIGPDNSIPVPTAVFKVVKLVRKDGSSFTSAFLFENASLIGEKPLSFFTAPIEEIETFTGLNLAAYKSAMSLCNNHKAGIRCDDDFLGAQRFRSRSLARIDATTHLSQLHQIIQEIIMSGEDIRNLGWKVRAISAKALAFIQISDMPVDGLIDLICPDCDASSRRLMKPLLQRKQTNREI